MCFTAVRGWICKGWRSQVGTKSVRSKPPCASFNQFQPALMWWDHCQRHLPSASDPIWSEKGARISREELELLSRLKSGVDALPAQGLLEKWDGGSRRARESSSSYAGHPAHPHCRSPPGSNFNSVPHCENKGIGAGGELARTLFFNLLPRIARPYPNTIVIDEILPLTLLSFKWSLPRSVLYFCWSCHPPRDVAGDFNPLCCKLWNILSSFPILCNNLF